MAMGRRDYTWGFLQESASEGRYSESFYQTFSESLVAFEMTTCLNYTVPEGKRLSINRIQLASYSDWKIFYYLYIKGVLIFTGIFYDNWDMVLSERSPYYLLAGENIKLKMYNLDYKDHVSSCIMIGCLENITL